MQAHASDLRVEIRDRDDADKFVHAVVRDWRTAGIEPRETALLEFAEKLTRSPERSAGDDIQRLRDAGWDDTAIHDATQIIAYFNYINRIADALGVEPEPGAPVWGGMSPPSH